MNQIQGTIDKENIRTKLSLWVINTRMITQRKISDHESNRYISTPWWCLNSLYRFQFFIQISYEYSTSSNLYGYYDLKKRCHNATTQTKICQDYNGFRRDQYTWVMFLLQMIWAMFKWWIVIPFQHIIFFIHFFQNTLLSNQNHVRALTPQPLMLTFRERWCGEERKLDHAWCHILSLPSAL